MKMTGQYRPFLGGQLHRFFHASGVVVGYLTFCAFNEKLCKLESEVFQKPHLRVAAKRYG